MTGWHKAADAKELPQGTMKGIEVAGAKVLLVHGSSGIRAFEDRCGHMSAPVSMGPFKSGVLKCALHAAVFDAETGAVRGPPQMHAPPAGATSSGTNGNDGRHGTNHGPNPLRPTSAFSGRG